MRRKTFTANGLRKPTVGIEPTTCALRKRRSAIEPRRQSPEADRLFAGRNPNRTAIQKRARKPPRCLAIRFQPRSDAPSRRTGGLFTLSEKRLNDKGLKASGSGIRDRHGGGAAPGGWLPVSCAAPAWTGGTPASSFSVRAGPITPGLGMEPARLACPAKNNPAVPNPGTAGPLKGDTTASMRYLGFIRAKIKRKYDKIGGVGAASCLPGGVFPDDAAFSDEVGGRGSRPAGRTSPSLPGVSPRAGIGPEKVTISGHRVGLRRRPGRFGDWVQDNFPLRTMAMTSHRPMRPANT